MQYLAEQLVLSAHVQAAKLSRHLHQTLTWALSKKFQESQSYGPLHAIMPVTKTSPYITTGSDQDQSPDCYDHEKMSSDAIK